MPAPTNEIVDELPGLVAKGRAGDNSEPFSVSEISSLLKRTVEDRFGYVKLRGELSGVKRAASGHLYCCMKDEKAVIDGVMWRGNAGALAFAPEDGLEVVASGKLTTYPGRSKYQIVIDSLELAGEGALLALLEKTKARLEAEGLFAPERKRPLPFLPRRIGVVTSPTGSVIRDILHRLADRFPSEVLVWPVIVQGQGAAEQVARAVRGFAALPLDGPMPRPDLVIVARGGGSIEDLWAFNEEVAVRAVAESDIPTICAVGHETDTSLCDYAADRRAPTPTAAAEMAVPVRADLAAALADFRHRQRRGALQPINLGRERLAARADRLPTVQTLLQPQAQRLDDMAERMRRGLKDRVAVARENLQHDKARLSPTIMRERIGRARDRLGSVPDGLTLLQRRLFSVQERFEATARVYRSLDPKAPLARGFVLVRDDANTLMKTAKIAKSKDVLTIEFADGMVAANVQKGASKASPKKTGAARTRPKPAPALRNRTHPRQTDLFGE